MRSAFPLGSGGGGSGSREGVDKAFAVSSPRLDPAPPAVVVAPAAAVAVGVGGVGVADELSELLARLNMTKYRPKFDSKKVRGPARSWRCLEGGRRGGVYSWNAWP